MSQFGDTLVLIVDDEESICEIIARRCHKFGYQTIKAHNGQEALDLVFKNQENNHGVDLIISDLSMPIMDGLQLIQELKNKQISIPIVILTGHGSLRLLHEALRLGAFDFIEKPFDETIIRPILAEAIGQKHTYSRHKDLMPFEDFDVFTGALETYLEHAHTLINFAESSFSNLTEDLKSTSDIIYLLRLFRELASSLHDFDLKDLVGICTIMTENWIQVRTQPHLLNHEMLKRLYIGFSCLKFQLTEIQKEKGPFWEFIKAKFDLNRRLYLNTQNVSVD